MITDIPTLIVELQADFDAAFGTATFSGGIAYQNARFDVPQTGKGVDWARWKIEIGEARQTTFGGGTNRFRYNGNVILDVFTSLGDGDADTLARVAAIDSHYRSVVLAGAQFRTPTFGPVGVSGEWWLTRLVCPFFADRVA